MISEHAWPRPPMGAASVAALATGLVITSGLCVVSAQTIRIPELPHVREFGAAAAQYDDGLVQVFAAYYHSQRSHDGPWLLVELGFNSRTALTLRRDHVELQTPEGDTVPLSGHRRWAADPRRARQLLLQARPTRHPISQYFTQIVVRTPLRFFTRPEDGGTVVDVINTGGETLIGDLLFESPTGAWAKGSYVLSIGHEAGVARLPIELR